VFQSNVVNKLQNEHGFTYARAAEQADLAALDIRFDQIYDLDAGLKHF